MIVIAAALALALQQQGDPLLVTAEWLAQHQRDPNLVLLHVGPRPSYDSTHIPGALYIGFDDIDPSRDTTRPALNLPSPAFFDSVLEARGISDDSRIVIYQSNEWFSPTTRVYFTLAWAGLGSRTSILDGGLAAWRRRSGAVTSERTPAPRRGTLTLHPREDLVVSTDWVRAHLGDPTVALVDARDIPFYMGTFRNFRPVDAARPQGHIPGAYSMPFGTMVDSSGLMLPVPRLRDLFASVRAEPSDTVVTYCHIGQQGTLVWFAARLAGYTAKLYDDSFTEWNKSAQNPVERF